MLLLGAGVRACSKLHYQHFAASHYSCSGNQKMLVSAFALLLTAARLSVPQLEQPLERQHKQLFALYVFGEKLICLGNKG